MTQIKPSEEIPPAGIPGCPRCAYLETQLADIQKRVTAVESSLAKNSGNSHKPPSSDGYAKPAPKSLRQKSDRPSGGQTGHPGTTLASVKNPTHTIVHKLTQCPCGCGESLVNQPILRHDFRQVFDLPSQLMEITEHRVEVKICPRSGREVSAGFPREVKAPTQYGSRFNGWLVYLRHQQLIPIDRVRQMALDFFGQSISEATVQSAVANAFHNLAGFQDTVANLLARASVAHADETGLRVIGKLLWLHVVSTARLTWYGISCHRGAEAINSFGILTRFTGRLIHDFWNPYFHLNCAHGLCNAHLLRELVFMHDILHQPWAKRLSDLLFEMHRFVADQKARASPLDPDAIIAWTEKYRAILAEGFAANPLPPPTPAKGSGRRGHSKAYNLLTRFQIYERPILAFLYDPAVPFTNNQAERDLRMMKVQQKISGTFRTIKGAEMFARVRSYLSTVRKNNRNVFQDIVAAIEGNPFIPTLAES